MKSWKEVHEQELRLIAKADASRFRRLEREYADCTARMAEWNREHPDKKWQVSKFMQFVDECLDERACDITISKDRIDRARKQSDVRTTCTQITEFPEEGSE